jgi:hypothetical protein
MIVNIIMFFLNRALFDRNIPLKDPTNVPDPYVKLYLLPGRSKDSKRKTLVSLIIKIHVNDSLARDSDAAFFENYFGEILIFLIYFKLSSMNV